MNTPLEHISLSQLNSLIGDAISSHLEANYWVVAEIMELRENYSGHCYLTLAEKEGDKVVAQSRASIWQQTYRMVKPYFENATGQQLASGIQVRIKVSVSYHNVYGINFTVQDIDPAYTVGALIIRRQQILNQLEEDGVADMNKELVMSSIPRRIAIISSPTAAGYEDFSHQLLHNRYGYTFETRLFPATMQGDGAESSVISAMEQIFEMSESFDVVVLIRGGGASIDLSCFDNYNIAYYITQFPLPVLVGIGHERDETVLDLVAHTSVKTPTAAAAFFIDIIHEADVQVDLVLDRLQVAVRQIVVREKQHIYSIASSLPMACSQIIGKRETRLNAIVHRIDNSQRQCLRRKKDELSSMVHGLQSRVQTILFLQKQWLAKADVVADLSDPAHLLKRGYSITLKDGKVIKEDAQLEEGAVLETIFENGRVKSAVVKSS